ncbi:type II secretion system F family protein [Spirillospora sp. NPDC052269]
MICAALAAWLFYAPSRAAVRLRRALPSPATSTLVTTLLGRAAATRTSLLDKRRAPARWRATVIELCEGMAAELTTGSTPEEAFSTTASVLSSSMARALRAPPRHDPIRHLEHLAATRPGAESLRLLAATWRLGAERGGTLATVLDGLAAALRDEESQRQEISVHLAAPRATARLLAVLPVLGLAMATALGTNPLPFLLTTLPGLACLTTALALDAIGLWWTHHLATKAAIHP